MTAPAERLRRILYAAAFLRALAIGMMAVLIGIYCARLGANAVHAAMAGKTGIIIGLLNGYFVHIPMELTVSRRNAIDPDKDLWRAVIESTGQPSLFRN